MNTTILITELEQITNENILAVESFKKLELTTLNWKHNAESWSILECIEHLNLYSDFYLPEIENKLIESNIPFNNTFKTGLLGNYFAEMMLPREPLNKMKTLKDKNPLGSNLDVSCLDRFLLQQKQMLTLLELAKTKNLTKVKSAISISKWIKLRIGDTFRVVIYHNKRHVLQAKNVLQESVK